MNDLNTAPEWAHFWQPDEVAECVDGVSSAARDALWQVVDDEVPGENDASPAEWRLAHALAPKWTLLPEAVRRELSTLNL